MTTTNKNLRAQTTSGLKWSAIERFGQQGFLFITGIVLARLLDPADFGLLAMVSVFVAIGKAVTDGGFTQVVIQRKTLTQVDLSTIFYFNIAVGLASVLVLYFAAEPIARFYKDPRLVEILRFLSVGLLLTSLGGVHKSQLTREMQFKRAVLATAPATLGSGGLAIVLALMGWGVWALVMQFLAMAGLSSLFLWFATGWRPSLVVSRRSLATMFPFGSKLALVGVLDSIFTNIYVLFIGRFFTPIEVGFYQRANSLRQLASQSPTSIIARVLFPTFSKLQNEPVRMRRIFLKAFGMIALVFVPLMAILAGVAHPLIETLIGARWLPSAPYLQLLCISGALYPLHSINLNVIKALGHAGKVLKIGVFKKAITIVVLMCTYRYGIYAIIVGQICTSYFALGLNAYYTRSLLSLRYTDQLKPLVVPVIFGLALFLGVYALDLSMADLVAPLRLLFCLAVAALIGVCGFYLLRAHFREELEILGRANPAIAKLVKFIYGNASFRGNAI